ncbi:unnamed protein product [Vicia faba]|uniref:Uncharacterized protein n=1 Tax=Vicia faba TaxID=3906 RepID=A0AAV0Z6D6_VICFA|nr:unnamed protein product [Vicia faba]
MSSSHSHMFFQLCKHPTSSNCNTNLSAQTLISPANIFIFGNSLSQNNGSAASGSTLSSTFLHVVSNSLTSQNMFSTSSLSTSRNIISATVTSTISMTTDTSVVNASNTSCSSTCVMTSLSPTTSLFKFGSTPFLSISLPVSSSHSEPVETEIKPTIVYKISISVCIKYTPRSLLANRIDKREILSPYLRPSNLSTCTCASLLLRTTNSQSSCFRNPSPSHTTPSIT